MSRGLGQGELLEAVPSRKLIVRPGASSWWGIDPSTLRVSIASVTAEGARGVSTASFPSRTGGARLAAIHELTLSLAFDLVATVGRPGVVIVEQPSGRTVNLELGYAVGVIVAAVAHATLAEVRMVASSRWKAIACGAGNIYKPKPRSGEEYGVLTWARGAGYAGSSWDEADAWGVADYARRTFALQAR